MDSKENGKLDSNEFKAKGVVTRNGVRIAERKFVDELKQRGYGVAGKKGLLLAFYESLYLVDRGMLELADGDGDAVVFRRLLQNYEKINQNAWACYLVFRDLRSRGYVVREGLGGEVSFRVYERGNYSKDTAKYLIVAVQEGKPIPVESLSLALKQSLSLKKELVLAVMNRRGEIVYYNVSELSFK